MDKREFLSGYPDQERSKTLTRIYELARKHCGKQKQWQISIKNLHKKSGSSAALDKFKEILTKIVNHDHLPDYRIRIENGNVFFYFKNYKEKPAIPVQDKPRPFLKLDTIEKAKRVLGCAFDMYAVESDWLQWWEQSGKPELQSPDGAFLGFCKRVITR